jgi:hypothetical protein
MKCWHSAFNAQGSRLIIVVAHIRSSSGGAREKGKTGWNSVYYQNWWVFLSFIPRWMLMYFFAGVFLKISPCVWPNSGFWCCVKKRESSNWELELRAHDLKNQDASLGSNSRTQFSSNESKLVPRNLDPGPHLEWGLWLPFLVVVPSHAPKCLKVLTDCFVGPLRMLCWIQLVGTLLGYYVWFAREGVSPLICIVY